ncbi:hypothetical protein AC579_6778 [Pseudocercospora musae]|uniref:Tat pathway signal sequence n=1 Tax=Pseudocercospora musae TaxID=113226 RepID=A0A139I3E2_9PEZI|nr:hypothetical protein AC579_6778 [Pseudocercospora musae]
MYSLKQTLHSYQQLLSSPEPELGTKCDRESTLPHDQCSRGQQRARWQTLAHITLTAALAIGLAVSLACGHDRFPSSYRIYGTYEHGFKTDLHSLKPTISLTNKKFYGGVHLDPNGTYWLTQDPNGPRFVGAPSEEVDQAWEHELLRKRYFGLTADETNDQFGDEFGAKQDWIFDMFWVSPSTYHNLHCLNYLRKSLSPEHYGIEDTPAAPFVMSHRMHLDHCIEQIRQSLMCSLDLTPIPRPWIPAGEIYHADLDRWHTCRSWDAVRDQIDWQNRNFVNEDFDNATAVWKKHISR